MQLDSQILIENLKHLLATYNLINAHESLLIADEVNKKELLPEKWERPMAQVCEEVDASDKVVDYSELLALRKTSFGVIMIGSLKI